MTGIYRMRRTQQQQRKEEEEEKNVSEWCIDLCTMMILSCSRRANKQISKELNLLFELQNAFGMNLVLSTERPGTIVLFFDSICRFQICVPQHGQQQ